MAVNTAYMQALTDEEQRRKALAMASKLAQQQAQAEADAQKGSFTKAKATQTATQGQSAIPTSNTNVANAALQTAQKALTEPKAASTQAALPTSNDKTMGTVSRLLSAAGGNMQDAPYIASVYRHRIQPQHERTQKGRHGKFGGGRFRV